MRPDSLTHHHVMGWSPDQSIPTTAGLPFSSLLPLCPVHSVHGRALPQLARATPSAMGEDGHFLQVVIGSHAGDK